MDKHELEKLICLYMDNQISDTQKQKLLLHLQQNPQDREILE